MLTAQFNASFRYYDIGKGYQESLMNKDRFWWGYFGRTDLSFKEYQIAMIKHSKPIMRRAFTKI